MLGRERWQRLRALFDSAVALPAAEQEAFARAQAADDPELLEELLSMLQSQFGATRRLSAPMRVAAEAIAPGQAPELPAGTRFGPWATRSLIGAGGMGQVYLGCRADGAYEREVAIKLMGVGALDLRHRVLFDHECRVLARMEHPAIAHIHDAGADGDGRPYLVMEYIRGEPIDRWCDHHALSMRARVELLATVCEGVLHAHQKGVIHRDLKPSNVLVSSVDGVATPKIIDFGIALHGSGQGGVTDSGGTVGYASPEQMGGGGDVDVRTDVYSLGALLHVLACSSKPETVEGELSAAPSRVLLSLPQAERAASAAARGTTPRRLLGELEDGLDAIVAKALQPGRGERYPSVSVLLEDLKRWLTHYPPRAGGRRRLLAARKFLRRHRLPVAAGAMVSACVLAGLFASLSALSEARRQERIASERQWQLGRIADFQQEMLESVDIDAMGHAMVEANVQALVRAGGDEPGATGGGDFSGAAARIPASDIARDLLHRYVVSHALDRLQQDFADAPMLADDLRHSLARVLISIGSYPGAAKELRAVLANIDPARAGAIPRLLAVKADLAEALGQQGEYAQAQEVLDGAMEHLQQIAHTDPARLQVESAYARTMTAQGRLVEALARQEALETAWSQRLGRDDPRLLELRLDLVNTLTRLTRRQEARERMEALLPEYRSAFGEDSPRAQAATLVLADLLNTFNEYERSQALAMEVARQRERGLGREHPETLRARALEGANRVRLAQAEPEFGHAEGFMRELLDRQERVLGHDHPDTLASRSELVRLLAKQDEPHKLQRAIDLQRQVLASRARTLGETHPETIFAQGGLASLMSYVGPYDEARAIAYAALESYGRAFPDDYRMISATWDVIGRIEVGAGRHPQARDAHATALRLRVDNAGPLDAHTIESASRLYVVLHGLGDEAAMKEVRARYLEPVVALDPAGLNASMLDIRESARLALQGRPESDKRRDAEDGGS